MLGARFVFVRLALAVALLPGCAQLLGLDETSGGEGPVRFSIERASMGTQILYNPQDLAARTAEFLVEDAADPSGLVRVPALQGDVGTWVPEAPLRAAAPILFDLPDFSDPPIKRIFSIPRAQVKTLFGQLEHPNTEPAPEGSMLTIAGTSDVAITAADAFQLFTVGSWAVYGIPSPGAGMTFGGTIPHTAMTNLGSAPGVQRITAADTAVLLRYNGSQLVAAGVAAPFEETTDAANNTIAATLVAAPIVPVELAIDQMAITTRYAAARPLVGSVAMSWAMRAAPGGILNNEQGPLLHAGGVTAGAATVTFTAGNPFASLGWTSLVIWATSASRTYTPPSAGLPVTLSANMTERAEVAAGLQMLLPAGLPRQITIDGTSLTSDGAAIARPVRAVEVTFDTDLPDNTLYQLQLLKLVPNAGMTALGLQVRLSAAATAPRFVIPPELFEPGALYTLRAIAVKGGFPAIATGDLTQRDLPVAISFLDSGVFQVMP